MDIGELVDVSVIINEQHDSETCAFCQSKKKPEELTNDFTDQHNEDEEAAEDSIPDYKFKNDAGKLGDNLGGKPNPKKVVLNTKAFDAAVAAHHLIPGNASLKNSDLFLSEKYLWKDGKVMGNIGYNINAFENGVWSPGNYGVRPWGTNGLKFKEDNPGLEPKDFAFAAIEVWRTQFHDAHEIYSEKVKDALDGLFQKLEKKQDIWCPEAKKEEKKPGEKNPLLVLVNRLNTISARMKRMLVFPTINWKRNIYTSRFAQMYMAEKPHQE